MTSLHCAARNDRIGLRRFLLDKDASINERTPRINHFLMEELLYTLQVKEVTIYMHLVTV